MCGIAGTVSQGSQAASRAIVQAMVAGLAHRGPDGAGVQDLGACVLGHTRLAIVDLSERGRQPMANEDETIWLTANGEIYNAAELRQDLLQRGHRFRSGTDTEVIVHLYEEQGEECVHRLRGMFAFAIWDARAQRLTLARDRFGIKPLYYARHPGGLSFASEIKALLAAGVVSKELDSSGVRAFLQLGHIPPPWTILRHVKALAPGEIAVWQRGTWEITQYWRLDGGARQTGRDALEAGPRALQARLVEVARLHLIADVPIVLFLSSGVDSACLAAILRQAGGQGLTTLTVGFEEPAYDESALAARTAHALGLQHRQVTVSASQVAADLDQAIWAMDQPTADGVNAYVVSRCAAEAGFKVAVSGQGGDELFGGYTSWAWFKRLGRLAEMVHPLRSHTLSEFLDRSPLPFRWRKLAYLWRVPDPFVAAQLAVKVMFLERDVEALVHPAVLQQDQGFDASQYLGSWASFANAPFADAQGRQDRSALNGRNTVDERIAFMDLHTHLEPRLLRDLDAMSMAHGLEVRPIFLDHELVEWVWAVPAARHQPKRLLLEAAHSLMPEELSRDLLTRPKRTFTLPWDQWLSGPWSGHIQEAFDHQRLEEVGVFNPSAVETLWRRYQQSPRDIGWSRLWSVYVLQRWCELAQVRADA